MGTTKSHNLPELFRPEDSRWASRAAARREIRRLARGLYTTNLDEPAEQLVRRRWYDVAALYFPGAVIVDRSAASAGPASDGSVFLDIGPRPLNPRPVELAGLTLRPRTGPGPVEGDRRFVNLHMSSTARTMLDNMRASRARTSVPRTLRASELEERLDRLARNRGDGALNELRDDARRIAPALGAKSEFQELDRLIGALLGTRDAPLQTAAARARRAGIGYDTNRLALFESLRAELASQPWFGRASGAMCLTGRPGASPVFLVSGASVAPGGLHDVGRAWRHQRELSGDCGKAEVCTEPRALYRGPRNSVGRRALGL